MTASVDNTAAEIPGVIRDPITAANLLRVNADGSINVVGGGAAAAGRLIGVQKFLTGGTSTYTPTTGTTSVVIEMVGGGGGGPGAANATIGNNAWGRPGAAGAYLKKRMTTGFSGKTIVVGAAGVGGSAGANPGTAGGDTTFDSTVLVAHGGAFGDSLGPAAGLLWTPPVNAPATATGGDVNVSGDPGGLGGSWGAAGIGAVSGRGGHAPGFGLGGEESATYGTTTSQAGNNAQGNGAGGSGGTVSGNTAAVAGGNGAPGACIIYEYS